MRGIKKAYNTYNYAWDWYDEETGDHKTWTQNGIDLEDWWMYLSADSRDFEDNGHDQTIYCTLYNEDGSVEKEKIFYKSASKTEVKPMPKKTKKSNKAMKNRRIAVKKRAEANA